MKKLLTLAVAVSAVALFAGCMNKPAVDDATTTPTVDTTTPTVDATTTTGTDTTTTPEVAPTPEAAPTPTAQ